MFKLLRNKRAQNTAEYAILFAVVIGAFTAMQMYVRRGLNARLKDGVNTIPGIVATQSLTTDPNSGATTVFYQDANARQQYEPYYIRGGSTNLTTTSNQGAETGTITETGGTRTVAGATSSRVGNQVGTGVQDE